MKTTIEFLTSPIAQALTWFMIGYIIGVGRQRAKQLWEQINNW